MTQFHLNFACSLVITIKFDIFEGIFEFPFWIQENFSKVNNCHIIGVSGFEPQKKNSILIDLVEKTLMKNLARHG